MPSHKSAALVNIKRTARARPLPPHHRHHLQPVRTRVFIFFITYTLFGFSRSPGDKKQSHAIN
jgi:hypothetical protein